MTSCPNQAPEEIVTEILMSTLRKSWLIVEGESDGIFFSTKELHGNPETVVALGWENVVAVISKVIEESILSSVFGFIDRDYREDIEGEVDKKNIVVSDFRDIEISLFESSALHRILVEYGSSTRLPVMECGSINIAGVKEKIYSAASKIGRLRYFALKNKLSYSIKDLNYKKLIDSSTLDIDQEKLIAQINSTSSDIINADILNKAFDIDLPNRLLDVRNLCSGHDVVEFLGLCLRSCGE